MGRMGVAAMLAPKRLGPQNPGKTLVDLWSQLLSQKGVFKLFRLKRPCPPPLSCNVMTFGLTNISGLRGIIFISFNFSKCLPIDNLYPPPLFINVQSTHEDNRELRIR